MTFKLIKSLADFLRREEENSFPSKRKEISEQIERALFQISEKLCSVST